MANALLWKSVLLQVDQVLSAKRLVLDGFVAGMSLKITLGLGKNARIRLLLRETLIWSRRITKSRGTGEEGGGTSN